jgi:hypothetical protein
VPVGATISDKPLDTPIETVEEEKVAEAEEEVEKEAKTLEAELGGKDEMVEEGKPAKDTQGVEVVEGGESNE